MNVITNIVPSALKSFSLLFLDNIKDVVATKNGINPDSQFLQVLNPATSVIASPATTQSESPISSGAVNLDFNWNGENLSYGVTPSIASNPNLVTVAVSSPTLTDWQTNWQRNFNLAFNAVPKSYRIPANLTDTNIQDTSENYAIVDTSVAAKNKLFLFLPGTSAQATYYQYIAREAAHLGYHVINLNYDNLDAVASLCLNNPDPNSYENVRLEALDGIDRTPLITVTPANSIQNRLIKMLQYMDVNNLGQGWGQYLPNGLPNWQKMVVAGHSQGGAEAAIIGKQHQVDRVVMFAPGDDYSAAINNLAPWISKPGATSADRYYGFKNTNDTATGLLSQTYQMWTMWRCQIRI